MRCACTLAGEEVSPRRLSVIGASPSAAFDVGTVCRTFACQEWTIRPVSSRDHLRHAITVSPKSCPAASMPWLGCRTVRRIHGKRSIVPVPRRLRPRGSRRRDRARCTFLHLGRAGLRARRGATSPLDRHGRRATGLGWLDDGRFRQSRQSAALSRLPPRRPGGVRARSATAELWRRGRGLEHEPSRRRLWRDLVQMDSGRDPPPVDRPPPDARLPARRPPPPRPHRTLPARQSGRRPRSVRREPRLRRPPRRAIVNEFTFDAGAAVAITEQFRFAVSGRNLTAPGIGLMPLGLAGGLGWSNQDGHRRSRHPHRLHDVR